MPETLSWLERQQFKERHPYTGAEPGGWGWTDLPGSVPDIDDTSGALLALTHFMETSPDPTSVERETALGAGLDWLHRLQNADGGWPTFCKGWGHLPFDRSGADLTGHALRALAAMRRRVAGRQAFLSYERLADCIPGHGPTTNGNKVILVVRHWASTEKRMRRGLFYLRKCQRPDGSWLPLWFGNQYAPNDENPTYGTARVLAAYRDLDKMNTEPARRGIRWLLAAQNADGGWGGAPGVPSSMEETALAVEVLLDAGDEAASAVSSGLGWLVRQVEAGGLNQPTPIGFYFAKLWYFEKLYPIIFTVAALGRALKKLSHRCEIARRPEQ